MYKLTSNHVEIISVDLIEPRTSVGKNESNAIVVSGEGLSDFHAEFQSDGGSIYIIDLGSDTGTYLNGNTVDKKILLNDGDTIRIGAIDLYITDTSKQRSVDTGATQVRSTVDNWKLIPVTDLVDGECSIEGVVVVGREKDNELQVPSSHISRQHSQLEVIHGVLNIKDLDSANGTFVNDEKITEATLKGGDRVRFDTAEFLVVGPTSVADADNIKTQVRAAVDIEKQQTPSPPAELSVPQPVSEAPPAPKATMVSPDAQEAVASMEQAQAKQGSSDSEQIYAAMSEGTTAFGEAWEETDEKSSSKGSGHTLVMPSLGDEPGGGTGGTMGMSAAVPVLICKTKPLAGKSFSLSNSTNTIGRAASKNDIVINEASVSSAHAVIINRDGQWYLEDKDSYNGVFVNRKKRVSSVIKNGDVIGIGRVQLVFDITGAGGGHSFFGKVTPVIGKAAKVAVPLVVVLLLVGGGYYLWSMLQFGSLEVEQYWTEGSGDRRNPVVPVIYDMNRDGVQDVLVTDEKGRFDVISGNNGFRLSHVITAGPLKSAPLLIDIGSDGKPDVVVASSNGVVQAYGENGKVWWTNKSLQGESSILNQPVVATIDNDAVKDILVSTATHGVVAINGSTGEALWNTGNSATGKVISRPLVEDINRDGMTDIVVITDMNELLAFTTSGKQIRKLWSQPIPPVLFASPVYTLVNGTGVIVIATQSNGVIAFNSHSGSRIWQAPIKDMIFADPVIIDLDNNSSADLVGVVTLNGYLHGINAESGETIWIRNIEAKVQATPLAVDVNGDTISDLVIADTNGNLLMIDATNGRVLSSTAIKNADRFVVSPVISDIDKDGFADIILVSQNGKLFAYRLTVISM